MTDASLSGQPLWLRILQFPLTRIIVLGIVLFFLMGWAQSWLNDYHNSPMLNAAIQIVLGLAAIGLYMAYGKFVERREVTELSTPGLVGEWAIGAACGAGLYTASAVILMLLGIYKVEGFNPWLYLLPNVAMAIKSGSLKSCFSAASCSGRSRPCLEAGSASWSRLLRLASFI